MTRVAFSTSGVDTLPGAPRAERREEADSGFALADATRAGCPERRELIEECADSCNKVDTTWLRLLSEQMFSPPITRLCYRDLPVTRVPGLMWALTCHKVVRAAE